MQPLELSRSKKQVLYVTRMCSPVTLLVTQASSKAEALGPAASLGRGAAA